MSLNYKWKFNSNINKFKVEKLCKEINISPPIAEILIQRGIETYQQADDFFNPNLDKLYSPFLMKGMDTSVDFIIKKIEKGEKILIYGDYDTDGITSVAMMYLFFKKKLTDNIETYIPNRFKEGYGLSKKGIDFAKENKCSLIITLDCGVTSIEEVEYAKSEGIDIIITDHHEPKEILPNAISILNPKQIDCPYPFKGLSGCGVGFKLIQGICSKKNIDKENYLNYLDYVGVSIAGDMVPVVAENRILLYYGLKKLEINPSIGFKPFLKKIKSKKIRTSDIVFNISPKINSSGRMSDPKYSLDILIEENLEVAYEKAELILGINNDRREQDSSVKELALDEITKDNQVDSFTTVVYNPDWHKGVLGIVASKLTENFYRPTIVLSKNNEGLLTGSARTIEGVDILELITKCSKFLEKFGGHRAAAGITLKEENLESFKKSFENEAKKNINKEALTPTIKVDTTINLNDINQKFLNILERMEPFGPDNMSPIFYSKNVSLPQNIFMMGKDKEHIKFHLGENNYFSCIGFNISKKYNKDAKYMDIIFTLTKGTFDDENQNQINIRDIR